MDELVFKNCVIIEFDFLVSKYGFRCICADNYYLRFVSDVVFIEICYDRQRSFEIDFSIGLIDDIYEDKERPFYLGEIVKFSEAGSKESYKLLQASTPDKLPQLVFQLAELVRKYANNYFSGDKFRFKALSDFRERECDRYAWEIKLQHIRDAVGIAWKKKDYACIVKLYEPVKDRITQAEFKKLEYSKKQQGFFSEKDTSD